MILKAVSHLGLDQVETELPKWQSKITLKAINGHQKTDRTNIVVLYWMETGCPRGLLIHLFLIVCHLKGVLHTSRIMLPVHLRLIRKSVRCKNQNTLKKLVITFNLFQHINEVLIGKECRYAWTVQFYAKSRSLEVSSAFEDVFDPIQGSHWRFKVKKIKACVSYWSLCMSTKTSLLYMSRV